MKKIVWLCNTKFTSDPKKATGTWLQPLAEMLMQSGEVEIINISGAKQSEDVSYHKNIKQYIVSVAGSSDYGHTLSKESKKHIINIIEEEAPDLIHVWGTESGWASVFDLYKPQCPFMLDIQGLIYAYTDYFYGGLTFSEILECIHLKEILMPQRTLFYKKSIFRRRGEVELKYLKNFDHISVQSRWVRDKISLVNPTATLYDTRIILRDEFYEAEPWQYKEREAPIIYTSTSAAVSYKGLHVLIKSLAVLKNIYPKVQLRIAGNTFVGDRLLDGYSVYLKKLVNKYKLQDNVIYLGSLNSKQIISELQNSNICVVPSFIETYCLAFAESMMVGTPTIVSYTGAMPELAVDGKEAIFYNSIDHEQCASHIVNLFESETLSTCMSNNARQHRLVENDVSKVLDRQLEIYNTLLSIKI